MDEKAEYYNKQGLHLVSVGKLNEAFEFFSKAIEIDPKLSSAYLHRGQILLEMDRIIEGNADIQKAKDLRSGKWTRKKGPGSDKNGKKTKLNWQDIENIYDAVFPGDSSGSDLDEYEGGFEYDFVPAAPTVQQIIREKPARITSQVNDLPAILELVTGKRLEIDRARLFEPTHNDMSIIRKDGHVERVIPLQNISCIHTPELPEHLTGYDLSLCQVEQVETVHGKIYHVAIQPEPEQTSVLLGCTSEEENFAYTLIPTVNIKKRCQDRRLGEILKEKGFIVGDILQNALDEHQQAKTLELGKIIALKSQVSQSAIEKQLKKARKTKGFKELKTGEILLASGIVNEEQVLDALQYQEYMQKVKIGQYLIDKGIVQEEDVYMALAEKFRIPFVDLRQVKVSKTTLTLLPAKFVQQNEILPIALENDILTVATSFPDISFLRDEIIKECKLKDIRFVFAQPSFIKIIIDQILNNF